MAEAGSVRENFFDSLARKEDFRGSKPTAIKKFLLMYKIQLWIFGFFPMGAKLPIYLI